MALLKKFVHADVRNFRCSEMPRKGTHLTLEEREHQRLVHLGHPVSLESRAKMSAAQKGRPGHPMSLEARAKIAAAKRGRVVTEETCRRISISKKGTPCSEAAKEATRRLRTGEHKSLETRMKMSAWQRGERNCQWKGGVTPENKAARNGMAYALWRTSVFERDDFTCLICDKRGHELEAHHINNFSGHEEERFVVENGVTLCIPCHKRFHLLFGKKRNTLQELQTFAITEGA
jgi:hypothetical protein